MISEAGPSSSTTRHVLLTLSVWMDEDGGSCYPSVRTISDAAKLSRRAVMQHLETAESEGWIDRGQRGAGGQGWRRSEYRATLPENVVIDGDRLPAERGNPASPPSAERGNHNDTNVVTQGDLKSTYNSPITDTSDFHQAWRAYPKRPNNSKAKARKAWEARLKAGVDPSDLLEGVKRYAAYIEATGTDPRFVKQAATFFGPDEHWLDDYAIPGSGVADDRSEESVVWDESTMGVFR